MGELLDDELYEITLDVVVDPAQLVENRLAKLGIGADIGVEFSAEAFSVPVTYRGTLEDLMEVAMNQGVTELEEFEELCRLVPKS